MAGRSVASSLNRISVEVRPYIERRSVRSISDVSLKALLVGTSALALALAVGRPASARPLGGFTAAPSAAALAAAQSSSQGAAQAARQATNALKRATQAIQAMQATQAAARAAARAALNTMSPVRDGLGAGGLQIGAGVIGAGGTVDTNLWQGANLPTQYNDGDRVKVDVNQTQQKAVLTWDTFNVGAKTDLNFNQHGNRDWVALNRVVDPSMAPSRILGNITADGSVYVINPNGIIFGGASQVNVGTLLASTAKIDAKEFLERGIYSAQTGGVYVPSFTGATGAITVEAGAQIATRPPAAVTSGGGFVLLMGSDVTNSGSISTPAGQTVLAAGPDFVLRKGYGTDANQNSTTRGIEISPGAWDGSHWSNGDGVVANDGIVFAQQGDITMAGRTVVQDGILLSTTSVDRRGTIHLLNSVSDAAGSVTLTGNSVTEIMPELGSDDTALNAQRDALIAASGGNPLATGQFDNLSSLTDRKDHSRIEIVSGGTVNFQANSLTLAQGGDVAVNAGKRVFAENGATIDVSGVRDVLVPMSANNILVNVQGNELRDSPLNRDSGALASADVWIDLRDLIFVPAGTGGYASDRYYTPGGLLEVGGYLANTSHTIGEWSAVGGSITLAAPEVIAQQGSVFDISGGSVSYEGGYIRTTNFRGADGRVYNVNVASANMLFTGIAGGWTRGSARWNVSETWTSFFNKGAVSTRWEDGYTVGRDAGQLIISAPTSVFEGDILADVVTGARQTNARPTSITDGYKSSQNVVALGGQLVVGKYTNLGYAGGYQTDIKIGDVASITAGMSADSALPSDRANTIYLDAAALTKQSLGGLALTSADQISVDAPVTFAPGARITLTAPNVTIGADITAHSGTLNLGNEFKADVAKNQTPFWQALLDAQGKSQVTIDNNAKVDLSGLWLNQLDGASIDTSSLAFLNGGTLNVATTGGVTFAAGSVIDVSSGAAIRANGKTQGGNGGNVSLIANDDSRIFDLTAPIDPSAALIVDGKIVAYGFNGGGTLTLKAGQTVVIGDDATLTGGQIAAGTATATSVRLAEDVVIPAGSKMPFDYINILSSTPVDTQLALTLSPTVSPQSPLVTGADWVVPAGSGANILNSNGTGTFVPGGGTVPSGSTVTSINPIPAGSVIQSSVFPHGIPTKPVVLGSYQAGEVVTSAVILSAGTVIPIDTKFEQSIAIQPVLALGESIFRSGFTSYSVSSNTGIEIASAVMAEVPVYRVNSASFSTPTGGGMSDAADLWLSPTYLDDPLSGRLTQRAGANLTFSSLYDFNMRPGSSLTVDPGRNVAIYANRQTTIEGSITAHGGNITVASVPNAPTTRSYGDGFGILTAARSIWIGEDSKLDVSGQAVTRTDARGHSYGIVSDGGSITLGGATEADGTSVASDAFIIVRPGAVLDASGTSAMIDVSLPAGWQPMPVASDGGTIALYSASGLYLDGDLRAASGGGGASGGLLSLNMLSHAYDATLPTQQLPFAVGEVPEEMQKLRNITIVQHDQPTGLSSNLRPGERDIALKFGEATISVDRIHNGGFDQLALSTHDLFVFSGDVDLAMNRSIVFSGGMIAASANDPHINVHLLAPYVKLDGWFTNPSAAIVDPAKYYTGLNSPSGPSLGTASDSRFSVDADLIDVSSNLQFGVHGHQGSGSIFFAGVGVPGTKPAQTPGTDDDSAQTSGPHIVDAPGFGTVVLHSSGDVRFGTGSVVAGKNLTIQADQIYPLSGATATIVVGQVLPLNGAGGVANTVFDPDAVLSIRSNGEPAGDTPASVFGNLALIAPNIDQGGVVRAPLGIVAFNSRFGGPVPGLSSTNIIFRDGSITSTSALGLALPFGGTSDGVTYQGIDGTIKDLGATSTNVNGASRVETGLMISGQQVTGEAGALLDVSGGGNLLGAGFISGRGGSLNVLTTALANVNPANNIFSSGNDKVYAIAPGVAASYAPLIATKGAGDPKIGQQITIPSGIPGLPAGTYTLLPSSYALLPGAYRVELGSKSSTFVNPTPLANGSVVISGYLGFAQTGIRDNLPTQVILTAGRTVRTYSQYNEMGYADFLRAQASRFEGIRPRLPIDGGIVQFSLGTPASGQALSFAGAARFDGLDGGVDGTLVIGPQAPGGVIDIVGSAETTTPGHTTVMADVINAFKAPSLMIGGVAAYNNDTSDFAGGRIFFSGNSVVNVSDGAVLRAGQIFLIGSAVNVSGGAILDTRGLSNRSVDSTLGYLYANTDSEVITQSGPAVLAVANGWFNFLPFVGTGSIDIGDGASLLTEGSIVLGAPGSLTMGDVNLGARYLSVTQMTVNVGTESSLAAAEIAGQLPGGWNLTQSVLDRLLRPSAVGGPALEQLTIVAGGSINFFGDVTLDARGNSAHDVQLVMNTPALYGLGSAGEGAHITADSFVWNGIRTGNGVDPATNPNGVPYGSKDPAPIIANGPGTGSGTLDISAQSVLFGYGDHTRVTDGTSLNRYAIGFSSVNVNAGEQVTTNSDGALFVGLSRDNSGTIQGGNLNITTPLLTAQQGAVMAFNAGGAISLVAPAGNASADTAAVNSLGGTVSFSGESVTFDTAAALPSGKLTLQAVNDVVIGEHAVIDLSGRLLTFFDKSAYSWGGDLVLQSAHGDIVQAAGSLIDVSAQNNVAGTILASASDAAHGSVLLDGALNGASSGGYLGGQLTIQAQDLGNFSALNLKLNDAGFFGSRAFDIKRGDLVIGNEVKASSISVSVDGGSLTVNGTIDASGDRPGTIRLAARDDLTLASSAVLDTHSTKLKTDSYGASIDADNTAHVELTTTDGSLILSPGATIDMRVIDPKNVDAAGGLIAVYGHLELNAPRTNETSGDIKVSAAGPLAIAGAQTIALNGFWHYQPTDDAGTIAQDNGTALTGDVMSTVNADGVLGLAQIDNNTQLFMNAVGSGLLDKIGGLTSYGNAFHVRPGIEIDSSPSGTLSTSGDLEFAAYRYGPNADRDPSSVTFGRGEPGKLVIRAAGDLKINGSITDGFGAPAWTPDENGFQTPIPSTVADHTIVLSSNVTLAEPWKIPNDDFYNALNFGVILDVNFNFYFPGDTVPLGTTIFVDPSQGAEFAWEAGITIPALVSVGAPRPVYALAQPLAPGSMSWSMRLVSGADSSAADSRILRSVSDLNGIGNMLLNDLHVGGSDSKPIASVIRTGTGDLELLAGGSYTQSTPYGVYTAGTQVPIASDAAAFNPGRGRLADDGTVLGAAHSDYEATLGTQYMYSMQGGGDLLLTAQGNINGSPAFDSREVGGWLWREGGSELGQPTAWGVNFGSYTASPSVGTGGPDFSGVIVHLSTFSGIGTLGGGNVNVSAGGNIGDAGAIVVAVGGSGRIVNGGLVQTGGGTLSIKAGGHFGSAGNQFVDLRGDMNLSAGDFGSLYGQSFGFDGTGDPRPLDSLKTYSAALNAGGAFVPGDGSINIRARGDIVLGDVVDPGRVRLTQQTDASSSQGGHAATWFTLWTQETAVNMFSAGGSVSPLSASQGSASDLRGNDNSTTTFLPSILRATAGGGDIFLSPGPSGASLMLPAPFGELQLLAAGSVIDTEGTFAYGPLGTSTSTLATPFRPGWATYSVDNFSSTLKSSNYWADPNVVPDGQGWKAYSFSFGQGHFGGVGGTPFVFGPNTVSDASPFASGNVSTIYAVQGDILNVRYGETFVGRESVGGITILTNYYRAAKPVQVRAGGDVVNFGGLIIQNDPNDVSTIAASGNIVYAGAGTVDAATGMLVAGLKIAGPGTLEVSAGRNLYEGSSGAIESVGPLIAGDRRPGASVVLQAGLGDGVPGEGQVDWTGFAKLYLDRTNLAGPGALADQPGKVAKTYGSELVGWLRTRFGYTGPAEDALSYFFALPAEQQRIFLRIVYYSELTAGGREFNDKSGPRSGSYLRGREAVAALFPHEGAYDGSITMFTSKLDLGRAANISGFVHTDFGGDIQLLAPGGGVTIGSEGLTPGADSGLITQGGGNVQIYSQDSILLGLSRIMTTFGGDIIAWSAAGDINAGRGSKTTVVFNPARVVYDAYGNISIAPVAPSTGAGIATLAPIAGVPAGSVDLIAPLGTIDAGEAGIRSSGNVNLAALHIVNASNIEAQGNITGTPTIQVPNVSGALTASSAAGSAQQTASPAQNTAAAQPSIIIVEVLGFGGGDDGSNPMSDRERGDGKRSFNDRRREYNERSAVQITGYGPLDTAQSSLLRPEEKSELRGH